MAAKKDTSKTAETGKVRLQKILSASGLGSRRHCEEIILQGQVTVNGQVLDTLPAFADPEKDEIRVFGKKIKRAEKQYFLLNKPKGVICTNYDPQGRTKAVDLIETRERIFCVGRLDADTTGAILLTNDTALVDRLTHPKYELPKAYEVRIRGSLSPEDIDKLKKGVWLSEGKTGRAAVKILRRKQGETLLQISISQGLNRQIRRSFARLGYKVRELKRVKIGKLDIKGVPVGSYRKVPQKDIDRLLRI